MPFTIEQIKKTKSFNKKNKNKSQVEYYVDNGAPTEIVTLVAMSNKAFGEKMNSIIIELLNLNEKVNTQHDATFNSKKIEIKSSRCWVTTKDFKFQHIMVDGDYEYLMFNSINFNDISTYIITKKRFLEIYNSDENIISKQGGGESQGLWVNLKKIKKYLFEINDINDFIKFMREN